MGPNNDIREEVIGNPSTDISKRYSSQEVGQKWKDRLPNKKRKRKENRLKIRKETKKQIELHK